MHRLNIPEKNMALDSEDRKVPGGATSARRLTLIKYIKGVMLVAWYSLHGYRGI